jgi:phosphoenolpyruvate carboxylase
MEGEETYSPEASRGVGRIGQRIPERRLRQMLQAGEFEGARDEVGLWRIPRRVIHQLLTERRGTNSFGKGRRAL